MIISRPVDVATSSGSAASRPTRVIFARVDERLRRFRGRRESAVGREGSRGGIVGACMCGLCEKRQSRDGEVMGAIDGRGWVCDVVERW